MKSLGHLFLACVPGNQGPDERIGWVGRWIDGRMTERKALPRVLIFYVLEEGEGWTGREREREKC